MILNRKKDAAENKNNIRAIEGYFIDLSIKQKK
jgi:hypothetical protein